MAIEGSEQRPVGNGARRPNLLRLLSEQDVLDVIFQAGPLSRPAIAERTGLSKATVGAAVDRLEEAGLVRARGLEHGRRGRSPTAYEVVDNAGFVAGVEIGAERIAARAADIFGGALAAGAEAPVHGGARAVSAQAIELLGRVVERASASHGRLVSIGVASPGVVDQVTRRVTSLAHNISPDGGLDPLSAIRARFDVPVLIENDVNLAALGESWHGHARGVSSFAFIWIGTGVGMGLVIDGELVRGAHGAAGEIGYLPSSHDPFAARHRLHGGLEDDIGAAGLLATFEARAPGRARGVQDVLALAASGDALAREVVDTLAREVGTAIASVVAVVDPELVVMGGEIGASRGLLGPVRDTVASLVPVSPAIESSALGDEAPLHGAVALALREARARRFTRSSR
jgi:predicted NBD/HSP70 family sugar kinase